ncbi:hypothetical protein W97_02463 [Coniosporium apollinis CBS 100218]|uniref:Myb-like domain-containing protein n=1 Tax=Coniosporium apollinis (strain CBS 100218) TaxID=1168221 RepID=R7YNL5_CONA1|nr:uncharacterized protein W97_02463 [Coniosporium apollinis CBS 100218]EON63236.1 hypothetical protein W97_02463 [Coniosporium apollinis CBS 100218]
MAATPQTNANSTRVASTWTPQDDEVLMSARQSGMNWQPIATKHFPSKTANACRKRHERLMDRGKADEWNGVKLETLAKEYMNVRKEMWTILAERLGGEKWTMVEAKCMEKGLKNLQAASRSAQRKERGIYDEGDSGIGCSDAENEIDDGLVGMASASASASSSAAAPPPSYPVQQQVLGYIPQQRTSGPSIQSMLSPSPTEKQ